MTRPHNLKTKIFLDSGNPEDTKKALDLIGFLDGQTTNPSLVSKHPEVQACLAKDEKCTRNQIHDYYQEIIHEIAEIIPDGDVSIEVYADLKTSAEHMLAEGKELCKWTPNGRVKFPTNVAGLEAADKAAHEGIKTNMTLVFDQAQAAAVHAATRDCSPGDVVLSPFIGRLDDRGENGMDLITNIIGMYEQIDSHVEVLTASVRSLDHFLAAIHAESHIITAPLKILDEWAKTGMTVPGDNFEYSPEGLKPIENKVYDLNAEWHTIEFNDPLINSGIEKFAGDWNSLIGT